MGPVSATVVPIDPCGVWGTRGGPLMRISWFELQAHLKLLDLLAIDQLRSMFDAMCSGIPYGSSLDIHICACACLKLLVANVGEVRDKDWQYP